MAKQNSGISFSTLKKEIEAQQFRPLYVLMGEEPFYPEQLCDLIIENALQPFERDFNQTILYGNDTNVSDIISICQRYPMMAERVLVVVKEAQGLRNIEELDKYLQHYSPTTVLVLLLSGKTLDARTKFYKNVTSNGVIFNSPKVSEDAMPQWIRDYFETIGLSIDTDAATLLAEYAGNDLRKLSIEAEKLAQSIPQERKTINSTDIENNIGISKEFNINELTNALAYKNSQKAFKIAYYFGESPKKYPIIKTLGFLFYFFSKLELLHAIQLSGITNRDAMIREAGVYYSRFVFLKALENYNIKKTMKIISYLQECDLKCKSNLSGNASEGELLLELIGKILA